YGRAAMQLALAEMRAAGAASVGVGYEDDNHAARRLYRELGFVETDEQPFGQPFAVLTFAEGGGTEG
ncbi:MAG TPA: GNAT family N-acetyltransferase, partial [Herpetosiphonaceae bacterium]